MLGKRKVQVIVSISILCLIIGITVFNRLSFLFNADEQANQTRILLPVDNERFVYINNPLIQGKALADAALNIYDNDTLLGTTNTDSSGNFYYKPSQMANGIHKISVKRSNDPANLSEIIISIDTSDPGKAILKSQGTNIIENDHPFYANGANQYNAIVNYMGNPTQVETDFATGCCVALTRETVEKIGFMDERQ